MTGMVPAALILGGLDLGVLIFGFSGGETGREPAIHRRRSSMICSDSGEEIQMWEDLRWAMPMLSTIWISFHVKSIWLKTLAPFDFLGGDFGGLSLDFGFWTLHQRQNIEKIHCLQGANPVLPQGEGPPRGNSREFFSTQFWSLFQVFGRRNVYGSNFAQFLGDFHFITVIRCSLCWWICNFFGRGAAGQVNVGSWNLGSWNLGSWNVGSWNVGSWNVGSWYFGSWNLGLEMWVLEMLGLEMLGLEMWGLEMWGLEMWGLEMRGLEMWGLEMWGLEMWGLEI